MSNRIHANDHVHNKDYWNSELRSLGVEPKRLTELNDNNELEDLADNLKQSMFQDYKTAYSHDVVKKSHFEYVESNFDHII